MLTTLIAMVAMVATADGGLPVAAPATVGMSAERLAKIDRVDRARHQGRWLSRRGGRRRPPRRRGLGEGLRHTWAGPPSAARRRRAHHLRSRVADQGRRHHHRAHDPVRRGQDPPRRPGRQDTSPSSPAAARSTSRSACCSSIAPAFPPAATSGASRTRRTKRAPRSSPLRSSPQPGQYYEYSDLGADMLGFVVEARHRRAARRVPRTSASSRRSA